MRVHGPEIFFDVLENTVPDTRGEVKIAYALQKLLENKEAVYDYKIPGKHYHCGNWKSWYAAHKIFAWAYPIANRKSI